MSRSAGAHEMYAHIERLRISPYIGRAHHSGQAQYLATSETIWIQEPLWTRDGDSNTLQSNMINNKTKQLELLVEM